ncbi:MAG TPA: class I SAM-dependent methyltransferase [Kofleriaceae bacterium]|nr:class I SAM-dependent methyltransferase [Kofleriaceae bacterium]
MPDIPGERHPADHFSTVAARYAAYRPSYPPALVALLRAHTHGDTAWDVGCGNGQLSVALGDCFAHVIATDLTQKQLDAAEPHPHVEYRCAPAEASHLPEASVDLVVAAQAAHWFDWPRFVAEVERVARPGALVALVSYGNLILDGEPGRIVAHYYSDVVGAYWPAGREHVENGYRDLVLPWPAIAAPPIDMTATWTRDQLAGYISSWSATARFIQAHGSDEYEALCRRLADVWPDNAPRVVRWPLTIKLARR